MQISIQGYQCSTALKLPVKMRTPLGSNVSIVLVTVDITLEAIGRTVRDVSAELSHGGSEIMGSQMSLNVSCRSGEAWYMERLVTDDCLTQLVLEDLKNKECRLWGLIRHELKLQAVDDMPPNYVADPPTEKQLRYAHHLGLTIPDNSDRVTVSNLIGQAEIRDPSLRTTSEDLKEKQRLREHGKDKIGEEAKWQALADAEKWMLVVFTSRKSKFAEVVRINGSDITKDGKIIIETEVMKLTKDRHLGPLVDVGRYIEIPVETIVWHEIVDEVDMHDVLRFQNYHDRIKSRA